MGIMRKRTTAERRRRGRYVALTIVGLFAWSFVASPDVPRSTAAGEEIEEPALSAYNAVADAAPVRGLIHHNTYLVAAEPAIARSTSEVALPSQATATTWLLDNGTVNGAHGTTTGNKVPTETTATQPGGSKSDEFALERGAAGNDALAGYGAGVSRSEAEHSARPRGYGYSYLGNVALLPAPGSPEAPPGTYDPEADEEREKESGDEDDPTRYTPNPRQQMAILSIGSVASTAETYREGSTVVAVSVAEINGINIGNRTADGRCTNCVTIDSLRVEARAESDGTGSKAWWRILMHRACRVAPTNDPETGAAYEGVTCFNPNPDGIVEAFEEQSAEKGEDAVRDPNARGVRAVKNLDRLDAAFAQVAKALGVSELGITLRAGTDAENAAVASQQSATASARGIVFELRTTAQTELAKTVGSNPAFAGLIQVADTGCAAVVDGVGGRAPALPVGVPRECGSAGKQNAQTLRTIRIALGQVRATTQALPGSPGGDDDDGEIVQPPIPEIPRIEIPEITIPEITIPPAGSGGTVVVNPLAGIRARIDWGDAGVTPWAPKPLAKGLFSGALGWGLWGLARRRFSML